MNVEHNTIGQQGYFVAQHTEQEG